MKFIPIAATLLLAASPSLAQTTQPQSMMTEFNPVASDTSPQTGGFPRMTPYPGTEQALRHQIEALEAGQLDYSALAPKTADKLRAKVANIQPAPARQWGTLLSLKYKPLWDKMPGMDVYEATFEHARVRWEIARPDKQGKIGALGFMTLS